jgi:hypothetical protein
MSTVILTEQRKLEIVEVKERMRKGTLFDTSVSPPKALKEFAGDFVVDRTNTNIVMTSRPDSKDEFSLYVHVYNADGKQIHEAIIMGCVDYYNTSKWIETHTESGGKLYVYDTGRSALRKLSEEEYHALQ